jgi:hypothetical protein
VADEIDPIDAPDYLLSDVAPVSDSELAQNRGGFAVGNLNISFGLSITTNIQGPAIDPITVTTNFTVDTPGHLTNLGTQISNQVNDRLAQAGIGGGSNNANTPPAAPTNTNAPVATEMHVASNGPSGSAGSDPSVGQNSPSTNSNVQTNSVSQGATGGAAITDGTTFTAQLDPASNSLSLTNNAGTNVGISTANGILTTISNTLGDVSVQTQVDLNFAINNYRNTVLQNSQTFQQAMSIAQQMLAIRGLAGH